MSITLILIIAVPLIGVFLLNRLLLWMEDQGWIVLTGRSDRWGSIGNAILEVQSISQPEKKHVLEAKRRMEEAKHLDESGDPPK